MGPAIVIEKISDLVYRMQTVQKGSQNCLNIDKLNFFYRRQTAIIMDKSHSREFKLDFNLSSIPN